ELATVAWALMHWKDALLNIVSDSLYVVRVVQRIEDALLKETRNQRLFQLLLQIKRAVKWRSTAFCIIHVRSHQWTLGLGEGNDWVDRLVSLAREHGPLSHFEIACVAHEQFHTNAKGLIWMYDISMSDAREIVQACPQCSHHGPGLGISVNPRGLKALEIWQMDVTHVPEFGRLKYVHVSIDTYSHVIWATAQPGERALHVKKHLTACFAVLGVLEMIKTDNGPAYASDSVRQFCEKWGIKHVRGIPNSPTGQAMVEQANRTLKDYMEK
ncbi:hypothetical protein N309_02832, partial [Tinamus guttatus]